MQKKYLLPELNGQKDNMETGNEGREGCWEEVPDAFDFLLRNLILTYESTESVFDGGSSGMPHVFEQMLTFNEAFFDESHRDHDRAVAEWKSVLCILALRYVNNLPLKMYRVDLTDRQENPFLAAASSFQLKEEPILLNTTWDFVYILMLGEEPIAFSSPLTILCPARMLKSRTEKLEWMSIQKIAGKTELKLKFDGRGYEYLTIYRWIDSLTSDLFNNGNNNPELLGKFSYLMGQLKELKDECHEKAVPGAVLKKREGVYPAISKNARQEFAFLNFCYDFVVVNERLNFLKEKHEEDIFSPRMLLLAANESQEAIFVGENARKIHSLIHNVLKMDGKRIISVFEENGGELALIAFLPLLDSFVEELEEHGISPEEFFETYRVTFDVVRMTLTVTLTIKEFPYSFRKRYSYGDCEVIYARNLPDMYIWPPKKIEGIDWIVYYTYYEDGNGVDYAVLAKNARRWRYSAKSGEDVPCDSFTLWQSDSFPNYIRIETADVAGYLPVTVGGEAICAVSGEAELYVDMGHMTTSVALLKVKRTPEETFELVPFAPPKSERMIGSEEGNENIPFNFLSPRDMPQQATGSELLPESHYFINRWNSYRKYDRIPADVSISPLERGYVVFDSDPIISGLATKNRDFICISYPTLRMEKRQKVHGYLEAILTFGVYEAIRMGCSYVQVKFLYDRSLPANQLGEYMGLYEDALRNVFGRTGVKPAAHGGYECMDESSALLYSICNREKNNLRDGVLYAGVDIGWEKTQIASIFLKDAMPHCCCTETQHAGRRIGLLTNGLIFREYSKMLSVLLGEPYEGGPVYGDVLREFGEFYTGKKVPDEYYHGLHTQIVRKIEDEKFPVSPDLYNNHREYRLFLMLMSFQFAAFFIEVGMTLGYNCRRAHEEGGNGAADVPKEIKISLGGNGAKYFRWIMNLKNRLEITEENHGTLFILNMKESVPEMVKKAFQIGWGETGKFAGTCKLQLISNPKCHLLEGYIVGSHQAVAAHAPDAVVFGHLTLAEGNDIGNAVPGQGIGNASPGQEISEKALYELLTEVLKEIFQNETHVMTAIPAKQTDDKKKITLEEAQDFLCDYSDRVAQKVTDMIDAPLKLTKEVKTGE